MTTIRKKMLAISLLSLLLGCRGNRIDPARSLDQAQLASMSWDQVVNQAKGTTVNYAMWSGDEDRNRFFQGPVAERFKQSYQITLRVIPLADTADVTNKLLNEKGAGKNRGGSIDMVWINGENFRTARQGDVLWGPFADSLPNISYYDEQSRARDFGTPIDGFEAPWQRAQFVVAYDLARVPNPPATISALKDWVKQHPGRFTYLAPPDFVGSVFLRHLFYHFGGGPQPFQEGFQEPLYRAVAAKTFEYLNELKPYLWRRGESYPATPREADRLFVNNEIDFTMSYGPTFASEKIKRGEYPPSVRTFVFEEGTIGNYSFLAIPFNAANPAGALVVINELMSPTHQLEQARAIGSEIAVDLATLDPALRAQAAGLARGPATLPAEKLRSHALPEPSAEYLERLEKDWAEQVLRK